MQAVTNDAGVQAALKQPHDWRRVGREVRILKRLKNSPAIIHLYEVLSLPTKIYLIQELAEGGSLLDYVRQRKRLTEDEALRIFLQIVAGLQHCHAHEVRGHISRSTVDLPLLLVLQRHSTGCFEGQRLEGLRKQGSLQQQS